jgi:ABC-type glycerol-3-phosphate transport system substrate-binding protein
VKTLKLYIQESNQGYQTDMFFQQKYLYEPFYSLVKKGRCGFAFYYLSDFLLKPPKNRAGLAFRWLAEQQMTTAGETILGIGVPGEAKNKTAAFAFLSWLIQPENQQIILEQQQQLGIPSFGIANGFSSIRSVNERYLPQYYPELSGLVPPESAIRFPKPFPQAWELQRDRIILPWIKSSLRPETDIPSLEERMEEWNLKHLTYPSAKD